MKNLIATARSTSNLFFKNKATPVIHNLITRIVSSISPVVAFNGQLLHTLVNPNIFGTHQGDGFSVRVAIYGDRAVVGANGEDEASGLSSGAAYVYDVTTGGLSYTLTNPNSSGTVEFDFFGRSVAVNSSYIVVGASGDNFNSGTVYVFLASTGDLLYTITNPNAYSDTSGDSFGTEVAVSDSYIIASATNEDPSGGSSGAVYIFDVTNGNLLRTIVNATGAASERFGSSIAITDNYAVIGTGFADKGEVYIHNPSTGTLLRTLVNPNEYGTSSNDNFGNSVAVNGDFVVVGANQEDDANGSASGAAYVFNVTTGDLLYTLTNPNTYSTSANDYFGEAVALNDNYVIVSAPYEDEATGIESGVVYVFDIATGNLLYTFNNPNEYGTPENDQIGRSLAISSNNYVIVGASQEDNAGGTSSGVAYIFNDSGSGTGGGTGGGGDTGGGGGGTAYDISTAVFSQAFNFTTYDTFATGAVLNPTGTKLFVVGESSDKVHEFALVTPYDLGSASILRNFDLKVGGFARATSVTFSPDGLNMYTSDRDYQGIQQYTLTTAFNVSTASYTRTFSTASREVAPTGVEFNGDGTKMFVCGFDTDKVDEYTLTTAYDISSASFSQEFLPTIAGGTVTDNTQEVRFINDGAVMLVVSTSPSKLVIQYDLSTAYDISTATYSAELNVSTQNTTPLGLAVSSTGDRLYMVGAAVPSSIFEYTVSIG